MYFLGYDIGSSSVKASLIDDSGKEVSSVFYPKEEMPIEASSPGFAEQSPAQWWEALTLATRELFNNGSHARHDVKAIGISYQMHGLVMVDNNFEVLRPSIIWCDSRAVSIGDQAFETLGTTYCLNHLLNSPGNFTASKLRWVKQNEPDVFRKAYKIMLPGDYIAMKLTGEVRTTVSGLSEGVFWDFIENGVSKSLLDHYELDASLIPDIVPTFGEQGYLSKKASTELGLPERTPITYRAGDQPNNAFSLNVLKPGEVAATAGTSGVVYAVTDTYSNDPLSRVNSFAHVNHSVDDPRLGILLCINGTGILNSWVRKAMGNNISYAEMNAMAGNIPIGSEGLSIQPFGNGAERVLNNKNLRAQIHGLEFNRHHQGHFFRAAQEGIVFALNYGFQVLEGMGARPSVIRAGLTNMFLSPIFAETLAGLAEVSIELFETDGGQGAARGAGVGLGHWSIEEAFESLKRKKTIEPNTKNNAAYQEAYQHWTSILEKALT